MKLLVMRHGEAQVNARSDAARNLTAAGQEDVRRKSGSIRDNYPDVMISSPLVRACQSAEIIMNEISYPNELFIWEELKSSAKVERLVEKLQGLEHGTVLLTSHQPLVSLLVSYLCDETVNFSPAQICCMQGDILEKHSCRLEWVR